MSDYNFTKNIFSVEKNIFNFNITKYSFDQIVKKIYKEYFKDDFNLNEIHKFINNKYLKLDEINYFNQTPIFGKSDRESIFIKIYHNYIDNNDDFNNLYHNFIINYIKPTFFSNEEYLVVQKTPNIRIHLPNCSNLGKRNSDPNDKIIGVHIDNEFNHDNEEINLIIPITDMFETNSIYHEYIENSNVNFNEYKSIKLKSNQIAFLYLNKWKHFNKINNTGYSRISFDTRIIPFSKYKETNLLSITSKKKFSLDNYFIKI